MSTQAKATGTFYLTDPCTMEATVAFVISTDSAEIVEQAHPDLPEDAEIVSVAKAREVYRRLRKAGWVDPDREPDVDPEARAANLGRL